MARNRKYLLWTLIFSMAMLLSVIVAPVIIGIEAKAHGWYPQECCSGTDCKEVMRVDFLPPPGGFGPPSAHASTPRMVVTTPLGTVEVPKNFPRRESKDNKMHACIATSDGTGLYGDAKPFGTLPYGTKYLRCIFLPPGM